MPNSESPHRYWLVIAIKIVVFLILFILLVMLLNRIFVPGNGSVAKYFSTGEPSDAVYMGTSSVLRIAPLLVDEASGLNTYNLATPLQTLSDCSLLLQESIARGTKPSTFLLYVNMRIFSREGSTYDYGVIRNLTGFRKLRMLFEVFSPDEYPEALLPCVYLRDKLLNKIDGLFINTSSVEESSDVYLDLSDDDETPVTHAGTDPEEYTLIEARITEDLESLQPYYGKNFNIKETRYLDPHNLDVGTIDEFYTNQVDESAIRYMDEIVGICRQNGINLVIYTLPSLPEYILSTRGDGYAAFHNYVSGLAENYGVPFWDLTYLRPEIAEVDSTIFRDSRHGNVSFSLRISRILGQLLREYKDGKLDADKWFFSDYESYQALHPGTILSIESNGKIYTTSNGRQYIIIKAVTCSDSPPEYQVTWKPEDGEPVVLCPWTERDHAVIGTDLQTGTYTLQIEARQSGTEETACTLIKTFTLSE